MPLMLVFVLPVLVVSATKPFSTEMRSSDAMVRRHAQVDAMGHVAAATATTGELDADATGNLEAVHNEFHRSTGMTNYGGEDHDDQWNGGQENGDLVLVHRCPQAGKQVVYLTFDDGPSNKTVAHATKLKDLDVKATYFWVTGYVPGGGPADGVRASESDLKSVLAMDHAVGSHTTWHSDLATLNDSQAKKEIDDSKATLDSALGVNITLFRPPYGSMPSFGTVRDHIKNNFVASFLWDIDSQDWNKEATPSTESLLSHIDASWQGGEAGHIILMHENKNEADSIDKLEAIVKHLRGKCPDCVFDSLDGCRTNGEMQFDAFLMSIQASRVRERMLREDLLLTE